MRLHFKNALILLLFLLPAILNAQKKGIYTGAATTSAGGTASLYLPSITTFNKFVRNAEFIVKADVGEDYKFGKAGAGSDFDLEVSFRATGFSGATAVFGKDYTVKISNNRPEGAIRRMLQDQLDPMMPSGLSVDRLELSNITVADQQSGGSYSEALSSLRLHLSYELAYAIDVRTMGQEINLQRSVAHKKATFTWSTPHLYPNYQLQVLRLYNTDTANITEEKNIRAIVDWSKAVVVETESATKQLSLTLSEGTGYYAWRIRPVGTYFDGGIAHHGNWGQWDDVSPADGDLITLSETYVNGLGKYFFFRDPDDDKNYIYSRTFAEENKIKESIQYATGLQQQRQAQVYIPSDNSTLVVQTIPDYLGRPSMQTMPVPVDNDLQGYKENFVLSNKQLYDERHFDTPAKIYNPDTVSSLSPAGSYYTGKNAVPSAEKYPFSRVLFYNDGTGRVKEESGVGKTHMLGKQSEGRGRTVRTFYSTPSADELLVLFGDEAPNHESVQKIVTIDQNNVASIAYKGRDGKVLATALSFVDGDTTSLLPLGTPAAPIPVKDRMRGSIKTGDAYQSAKRVSFTDSVALAPEYLIECKTFELLCADVKLTCGYEVKMVIHNLDSTSAAPIVLSAPIRDQTCETLDTCDRKGKYRIVRSSDWTGATLPIRLGPGNYMIEKKLIASSDIEVTLVNQEKKIQTQVGPLKDWIVSTLEAVQCPEQLQKFYRNLVALGNVFTTRSLQSSCANPAIAANIRLHEEDSYISFPDSFMAIYCNPELTNQFSVRVVSKEGELVTDPLNFGTSLSKVYITTPCCENIELDVRYQPYFKCVPAELFTTVLVDQRPEEHGGTAGADINHDFLTRPEWTEVFPDFEGYALSMLMNCSGRTLQEAESILYGYMPGWAKGDFNKMTHHMLTDVYACEGKGVLEGVGKDPLDKDTVLYDPCYPGVQMKLPGTQYNCSDLAACWSGLVMVLSQAHCLEPGSLIDDMNTSGNISNTADDNNDDDGSGHNNHFDDGIKNADMSGIMKWLAKKSMSKKVRDMQEPPGSNPDAMDENDHPQFVFHMVDMFLRCTGYRFADVLEPQNVCSGNGVVGPFNIPEDFDGDTTNGEYRSCVYKANNWASIPVDEKLKVGDLFPNIQNPVYAFKYYEYTTGTFPNLEFLTCFRDPNDCWIVETDTNGLETKITIPCCLKMVDNNLDLAEFDFCYVPDSGAYHRKNYDVNRNGSYDDPEDQKLNVLNFCGNGPKECPFEEPEWDCNQRLLFFEYLKSYREYKVPLEPDLELACSWMSVVRKWYQLPELYKDSIPNQDYVSIEQFEEVTGKTPNQYDEPISQPVKLPGVASIVGDRDTYLEDISYFEYEAVQKKIRCETNCEDRVEEFRWEVQKMFADRCYVIDDCKRTDEDNIVSEADIDRIVQAILLRCKEQCPLTTYACETKDCRFTQEKLYQTGPNSTYSDVTYGVGGHPGRASDCPAGTTTLQPCCTNLLPGNINLDNVSCGTTYDLSFYELTNHRQAMGWMLELELESMCNVQGQYVDADNDGRRDDYPLYVYQTDLRGNRSLKPQDPAVKEDIEVYCPVPPVGNTFVELHEYEVKNQELLDMEKVYSPKIGLSVTGGQ